VKEQAAPTGPKRSRWRSVVPVVVHGGWAIVSVVVLVASAVQVAKPGRIELTATSGPVFDDFLGPEGALPDARYWSPAPGGTAGAGAVETNTTDAANVRLDGKGHLVIQALATPTGYTSGRVVTYGKVEMLYGRVEARILLPTASAIWPGFWFLGTNFLTAGWPYCGEIDVIDMVTDSTGKTHYYAGLHGPTDPPDPNGFVVAAEPPDGVSVTGGFHTYWANREPNLIQIGVDDTQLAEYTPASLPSGAQWVFESPMYAILNIAVGNAYTGPPDGSTPRSATMLVDWFRFTPS
jgi:beta-glucanase (GH16 family)